MRYPEFIKKGDMIGISAPSAGVGKKLESYTRSINVLEEDYQIYETASVRVNNIRSNTAVIRAKELTSLFMNDEVKMVMAAAGGDFLYEILPFVDWEVLNNHPKWFMGASDPTSIAYILTTKYDIASLYGLNAGSFDTKHTYTDIGLEYLKGNLVTQESYDKYQSVESFLNDSNVFDLDVKWVPSTNNMRVKGRMIGGCLEVIKDLMGTEFDATKDFMERYKEDGFIFYIDNFALSAENMYRTLLQLKYAGYFKYTKLVLVGRVLFESTETGMTYEEAVKLALDDIPYIYGADVGHVSPKMMMINGAMAEVSINDNKAKITYELK